MSLETSLCEKPLPGEGSSVSFKAYHGSNRRLEVINHSRCGAQGPGIYLTDRAEVAAMYGDVVMEVDVVLRKPFYFYPSDDSIDAIVNPELITAVLEKAEAERVIRRIDEQGIEAYGDEVYRELRRRGHDGIIMVCPWGPPALDFLQNEAVIIALESHCVSVVPEPKPRRKCRP